jgi:hypothetical protein
MLIWPGAGALAALVFLALTRGSPTVKPVMKVALKEGVAFREWLLTRAEHIRADMADAAAEALHDHAQERDFERLLNALASDRELLAKVEALIRSHGERVTAGPERPRPRRGATRPRRSRARGSE